MGQINEFVGSMAEKEPLPKGLRLKSSYALLNNFDVEPLCLQLFASPKAILSLNIKNKQKINWPSSEQSFLRLYLYVYIIYHKFGTTNPSFGMFFRGEYVL